MLNPFDNPDGRFLVLVNETGHQSLWPVTVEVPASWAVFLAESSRDACLAAVEER
ncbi:MbtH family protein [Streptomyces sp. NPDC002701]|uniref:MbtH family protein n=1 Tax=Streptomyces sp. NPDC002701 TaxID=3364661 RepID=UPI0036C57422